MTPTIILRPGKSPPRECFDIAERFIRDYPTDRIGINGGIGYGTPGVISFYAYRTPTGAVVVRGEKE